ERYMTFLNRTAKKHIRDQGSYGDWLNLGGGAKSEVIGTAYYYYVSRLMSEMAGVLKKENDAAYYGRIADETREAFIRAFINDDGSLKDSSQSGYALAFTMDILPANVRRKVADRFIAEIKNKDWHLATGFIG